MDDGDIFFEGEGDDALDVEIRADGTFALADNVGFIGLKTMDAETVFLCIDGNRAQPHLGGGAKNADGDLAAIGDQQLALRRDRRRSGRGGCPTGVIFTHDNNRNDTASGGLRAALD